jgi:5-methylthioadenosine/S-adenosylhomocysteine deaminase
LQLQAVRGRREQGAERTLLKGGVVLSFDRGVGDSDKADVLIEGRKIAAVQPNISATATVIDAPITRVRKIYILPTGHV